MNMKNRNHKTKILVARLSFLGWVSMITDGKHCCIFCIHMCASTVPLPLIILQYTKEYQIEKTYFSDMLLI